MWLFIQCKDGYVRWDICHARWVRDAWTQGSIFKTSYTGNDASINHSRCHCYWYYHHYHLIMLSSWSFMASCTRPPDKTAHQTRLIVHNVEFAFGIKALNSWDLKWIMTSNFFFFFFFFWAIWHCHSFKHCLKIWFSNLLVAETIILGNVPSNNQKRHFIQCSLMSLLVWCPWLAIEQLNTPEIISTSQASLIHTDRIVL